MAVKNYTKTVLIRAREGEARSWARSASEGGKRLSTWIRETLNEGAGYNPEGLSSESDSPEPEGWSETAIEHEGVQSVSTTEPPVEESKPTPTPTLTDDELRELLDREFNQ